MYRHLEEEFDIITIYRKLTMPSKPILIKASEFFRPQKEEKLADFQQRMNALCAAKNR
ncbi:MAG: hypothetical protein NC099_04890 [Corallococcus sp.]|nr:hypothetical protein [Corallococcus sp.]